MTGVSLLALGVSKEHRQKLKTRILLLAFGIEISSNGTSAIKNCIYLIVILMLRMIQDVFSLPYILATF